MSSTQRWCGDRQGAIDEMAFLVRAFAALKDEGRADLLDAAACALAERLTPVDGTEVREWLAQLADSTVPSNDDATRLIDFACGVEPSAKSMLFDEGVLGMLLAGAARDRSAAEGLLTTYVDLRNNADSMRLMPEAAEVLSIRVASDDFEQWQDDAWVVDEAAWRAEVQRRCVASVASMLGRWRERFFAALLG